MSTPGVHPLGGIGWPAYLDPGEYRVKFACSESGVMHLIYPYALVKCTQTTLRKFFELMCLNVYRDEANQQAIAKTYKELQTQKAVMREAWGKASIEYQNGWKLGEARGVKANNKKLGNALKAAKRADQRINKVEAAFLEICNQHDCTEYLNLEV